jgi:hypothetical protein
MTLRKFLRRKRTAESMFGKKRKIIASIPKMSDDELYNLNVFLVDVLSECANELRYRSRNEK